MDLLFLSPVLGDSVKVCALSAKADEHIGALGSLAVQDKGACISH